MTKVNCFLEECIFNKDCECTRDEITLDEDHMCIGGCDDGWVFEEEEEEEDDGRLS